MRALSIPVRCDFVRLSSYGEQTTTSGEVKLCLDVSLPLREQHVLLVEDIIDTGLSLTALRRMMADRGAASVSTAALADKTRRRVTAVPIEYRGFEVGDEFLIGYGLDWQGHYRNLRSVWAVLDMEALIDDPRVVLGQV